MRLLTASIFITNDEGCGGICAPDYRQGQDCTNPAIWSSNSCHIPTFVIAPNTPAGTRSGVPLTLYSILRTVEEQFGFPLLGHAADTATNSMIAPFHLGAAQG